ncbi:DUF4190 domain-containing protein [Naasia lichenicola]|uniref:DUF4190 domain-containing protein n=1 Tax=Naasia lichenicola TaxID=2565933 RepID=A0A4S4FP21_9MICO|nr:DUF4190 domain-containing protein [Naasia lichenicola]THG30777.1 DUF4190 domain-containing protein [Naasia lichenicola]THG32014.1 DUF4190 domain-containing protein [Naasia lichenicola]
MTTQPTVPAPPTQMPSVVFDPYARRPSNGLAVAALVLGIVAIVFGIWIVVPLIGIAFAFSTFVPALLAVIFGFFGVRRAKEVRVGRGMALTGITLGGVTLALSVITTAVWVISFAGLGIASSSYSAQQAQQAQEQSQPDPEPVAPAEIQAVYPQGVVDVTGVSQYSDVYYANILGASVEGNDLRVSVDAMGNGDLRAADSSCIHDSSGFTVRPLGAEMTVNEGTHRAGDLIFSLVGMSGPITFTYSCQTDYSTVELITP